MFVPYLQRVGEQTVTGGLHFSFSSTVRPFSDPNTVKQEPKCIERQLLLKLLFIHLSGEQNAQFASIVFKLYAAQQNNTQSLCEILRVGCIFLSPYSHFVEHLCKTYHCVTVATTFYNKYNYLYYLQRAQLFKLSTVGTAIYTVYSRYNYLHCLQQVQISTLSTVGTTIYTVQNRYNYLHCPEQVQLSTLPTVSTTSHTVYGRYNYLQSAIGTAIYTVYRRYNYLHSVQQVELSTLSTVSKTIHTAYIRYSYLHCLQQVQLSTLSITCDDVG